MSSSWKSFAVPPWMLVAAPALLAARSYSFGGIVFVVVPLLGFWRVEVAAVLLCVEALLIAALTRCSRLWWRALGVAVVLACCLAPQLLDPARLYIRTRPTHIEDVTLPESSVTVVPGVIPREVCDQIVKYTWDSRWAWTKISRSLAIGSFRFGGNWQYDGSDTPERNPAMEALWSFRYGFKGHHGYESDWALAPAVQAHRDRVLEAVHDVPLPIETMKGAMAAYLNAPKEKVLFGGEVLSEDIDHRLVNRLCLCIFLPHVLWHMITDPHSDVTSLPHQRCDPETLTAFIFPLSDVGSGLLWWTRDNVTGGVREHSAMHEVGSMYAFPAGVLHSQRPWPYKEWSTSTLRVTCQIFTVRCGDHFVAFQ